MARIYTNYLNDGRAGCTWASLVGITIGYLGKWPNCRLIAEAIWGRSRGDMPQTLMSQVNTALNKLIDNKLVTYRKNQGQPDGSRYEYELTSEGLKQFASDDPTWEARNNSDSKLFQPDVPKKKTRRNNVVRFRPVRRAG